MAIVRFSSPKFENDPQARLNRIKALAACMTYDTAKLHNCKQRHSKQSLQALLERMLRFADDGATRRTCCYCPYVACNARWAGGLY